MTAQVCDDSVSLESKARFCAEMLMLGASVSSLGATDVANRCAALPPSEYFSSVTPQQRKIRHWVEKDLWGLSSDYSDADSIDEDEPCVTAVCRSRHIL